MRARLPGIAVFLAAFAAYAATASPAIGWLDSPEFVAVGASLGIAHSPGHPLAGLLGRLATLVPVGDAAFRVNLLSAACGAAAAAALYALAREALGRLAPAVTGAPREVVAAAVALTVALSVAAWRQSVRAEVYALQAALLFAGGALVLRWDRRPRVRPLAAAGLAAGLAGAHHHWMAALFFGPVAVFALARRRPRRPTARAAATAAAAAALGLASFAYLPVRAAADPEVNWGDPRTADRFAWTVTARAFHRSLGAGHVSSPAQDAAEVTAAVMDDATPVWFALAVLGAWAGLRTRGQRGTAALLMAIAGAAAGARVALGYDPGTPDHDAYLWPAIAAVAILGAAGLARLADFVPRTAVRPYAVAAAAVAAAVVPWQAARSAPMARMRGAYASDDLARVELDAVPPRAVLLIGYFQTSFRIAALRAVEAARPDVAVLDRSFLTYPGFADVARRRYPELAAILDAPLRAGAPTPVRDLVALRRPVWVQLHPNLDDEVKPRLVPEGWFARLAPAPVPAADRDRVEPVDAADRDRLDALLAGAHPADREPVRDALLWHDYLRAEFYCQIGRVDAGRRALARARRLAPDDVALDALARRCGPTPTP
ncbi:MAG: DUF2723 domain-containing protein [Deltaproteobacteria bacterium]|nr:MAG: DUF2723 domain-containing protein [Deltaproteobacteria bacterium]